MNINITKNSDITLLGNWEEVSVCLYKCLCVCVYTHTCICRGKWDGYKRVISLFFMVRSQYKIKPQEKKAHYFE